MAHVTLHRNGTLAWKVIFASIPIRKLNGDNRGVTQHKTMGAFNVFVSHSHLDYDTAASIKRTVARYGLKVFVAHKDISPSVEWRDEIAKQVRACDLFVALLTQNYKTSLLVRSRVWSRDRVREAYSPRGDRAHAIRLHGAIPSALVESCQVSRKYESIALGDV